MSNVFVISDTHFFHKNILEFEKEARPFSSVEEMNETLVDNWNRVVGHKDVVWHLGDVLFGKDNFYILDRLNGRKNLVLGNHDHYGAGISSYTEKFRDVQASKKLDDFILTHIPVHTCQFGRYEGNIHGHLHSKVVMDHAGWGSDRRYVCVCVEQTNLAPVAWDCVKQKFGV